MKKLSVIDADVSRRDFICSAASVMAVAMLSGCAAALVTHTLTPVDGKISIDLNKYPELKKADGSVKIQPEGAKHYIYLLAAGNNTYTALSPVCTHAGCIVDVRGANLVCPCHNSIFDRTGDVLDGPAPTPLPQYPTVVNGNVLTIDLRPVA